MKKMCKIQYSKFAPRDLPFVVFGKTSCRDETPHQIKVGLIKGMSFVSF